MGSEERSGCRFWKVEELRDSGCDCGVEDYGLGGRRKG